YTRACWQAVDHATPRIDQHRIAMRAAAVAMGAALCRGEDVALVLDRPRAQQHFPVRLACHGGEGRGYDDQRTIAERAVELGKPQVVAHRQADAAAGRIEPSAAVA